MSMDDLNDITNSIAEVRDSVSAIKPLSFRDQCAIKSMCDLFIDDGDFEYVAKKCFDLADAMEAERQKRSRK